MSDLKSNKQKRRLTSIDRSADPDLVFAPVSLMVGWFDCFTNRFQQNLVKGWDNGPRQNPLHFGMDPDKGWDPGFVFFFSSLRDWPFFGH